MEPELVLRPVLVFDLKNEVLGVRLDAVKEIHRPSYLQRVPLAPPSIRGLADVRGRMITAVDVPALVGGEDLPAETRGHLMILAEPRDHMALWLPSEIGLRNLDLRTVRPRPPRESEPELFEGFVASGPLMVNVLSTEKVFLHCEREVLRRYRVAAG